MWAFVDSERQPCVVCHDVAPSLYWLTAMSVVALLGEPCAAVLRSSSITFPSLFCGCRVVGPGAYSTEGMVDNSVLPAISPESWRSCARISGYEESNREPHLEEIACSTAANITKLKCVLCVCPYVCNVYEYARSASFLRAD